MLKNISLASTVLISALSVNVQATDYVIILDTTGSVGALLPNWKARMQAEIINPILASDPTARFGLASHLDFPFTPYGASGEYAYRIEAPLNNDLTVFNKALAALTVGSGYDSQESQLEAIHQANTGVGLDLNGDGDYYDAGDIIPSNMGFNPLTPSVTMHFTAPLDYHNHPVLEPDYPYVGVVNHPVDFAQAQSAMVANNNIYFAFVPTPLPLASGLDLMTPSLPAYDAQTYMPLSMMAAEDSYASVSTSGDAATAMAKATGGEVLVAGSGYEGLKEAVERVIEKTKPCPDGFVQVVLPFGAFCVPDTSPLVK